MPIPVITNFKVNTYGPIDTRLVATNSAALSEIEFPYEGLTVFTKNANLNYTYNGTSWAVSSNGIYGGSGSMVGTTDVNMGMVGSNLNDKAFELVLSASASTSGDRVQFATSFIRNNGGTDFDSVEIRNQANYLDGGTIKNGPYISFNKNDTKKGIISFGTPDRNFVTTAERLRIEPDSTNNNGAIVLFPSTYSYPLYVSQKAGVGTFIGYNYNGTSKLQTGTAASYISFNGGQISFFSSNSSASDFSEILRVSTTNGGISGDVIALRSDITSNYLDSNIMPSNNFYTITKLVRNVENRFTKIQHLNYKLLEFYNTGGQDNVLIKQRISDDNTLIITDEGNFFDVELPVDYFKTPTYHSILNIKISRYDEGNDQNFEQDLPPGTEIKIRFTYEVDPFYNGGDYRTRIFLWQNAVQTGRKIKSSYADTNGGEYITILHNPTSTLADEKNEKATGDIISFIRGGDGFWYVSNINREKQILKSISQTLSWTSLYGSNTIFTQQSPLQRMSYSTTAYSFNTTSATLDINPAQALSDTYPDHPFKHKYPISTELFNSVNSLVPLQIARDLFGVIYIKGYFGIKNMPGNQLNKDYKYGIGNKIHIANIVNSSYLPTVVGGSVKTSWGYCEVVVSCDNAQGMPFGQSNTGAVVIPGRLTVDEDGKVFVHFHMSFWGSFSTLPGNYKFDVNVPMFSYQT